MCICLVLLQKYITMHGPTKVKFVILHLLIPVCKQFVAFLVVHCSCSLQCAYVTSSCRHLPNPFPPPSSVPHSLFRGHNLGFLAVSLFTVTSCRLSPNLQPGRPFHRIYNPWGRVAQLYPQAPGTHFGRPLRPAWAAVGLLFSPVATRGK